MCAVVSFTSAVTVYLRDTRSITEVALIVLFYLTPVFYSLSKLHSTARQILYLNPMTTMVDGWRNVSIEGRLPDLTRFGLVTAASVALAALAVPSSIGWSAASSTSYDRPRAGGCLEVVPELARRWWLVAGS